MIEAGQATELLAKLSAEFPVLAAVALPVATAFWVLVMLVTFAFPLILLAWAFMGSRK